MTSIGMAAYLLRIGELFHEMHRHSGIGKNPEDFTGYGIAVQAFILDDRPFYLIVSRDGVRIFDDDLVGLVCGIYFLGHAIVDKFCFIHYSPLKYLTAFSKSGCSRFAAMFLNKLFS